MFSIESILKKDDKIKKAESKSLETEKLVNLAENLEPLLTETSPRLKVQNSLPETQSQVQNLALQTSSSQVLGQQLSGIQANSLNLATFSSTNSSILQNNLANLNLATLYNLNLAALPSFPLHASPILSSMYTDHKRKGGQIRFTGDQTSKLEILFNQYKYLTPQQRKIISDELNLSERQVKTWFQNRRAKWRRVHGSSDI